MSLFTAQVALAALAEVRAGEAEQAAQLLSELARPEEGSELLIRGRGGKIRNR